jgi:hypothetical protein
MPNAARKSLVLDRIFSHQPNAVTFFKTLRDAWSIGFVSSHMFPFASECTAFANAGRPWSRSARRIGRTGAQLETTGAAIKGKNSCGSAENKKSLSEQEENQARIGDTRPRDCE